MVGGISTGVALMMAINIINASILASIRRTIDFVAGPAALEVTLGVGEVGFPETIVDDVRRDQDVAAAVPFVRGTIALGSDPARSLQLFGADLTAEEDLERYHVTSTTARRDLLRTMEDPRSILITRALATDLGLAVGGSMTLTTPRGVTDFTIRGLLEAEGLASVLGDGLVVMDLPVAQRVLNKEGRVDQIDIIVRGDRDVPSVQRRLQSRLPGILTIDAPAQRGLRYENIFASFQAMLTGISTLCLVAGIFIIYNTTSTAAAQRASTMAGLRLIGADADRLFGLLMVEALVLGALGTISGIPVSIVLAKLLCGLVSDSMGVIFKLRLSVPTLAFAVPQQGVIALLGVTAALFASYFAARRLTTIEPLSIIRSDAIAVRPATATSRLLMWWMVLVIASGVALASEQHFQSVVWGNLGATLWNSSIIVIAVPLVAWVSRPLHRLLPALFRAEGRVAVASIFRSPVRTGVTIAAVALVVTTALVLSALSSSFSRSVEEYMRTLFAADLSVSAVATEGGYLETPLPLEIARELEAIPGVVRVETARVVPGQIYRGQRIGLLALSDGFFDSARYPDGWYREGDPIAAESALRDGSGLSISTALADRFALHLGDVITLDTPTGALSLPVVGVVPDYVADRGSVVMSYRLFADRWREPTVNRFNLFLAPGTSLESARRDILDRLGARFRLKVLSLRELLEYHDAFRRKAFAFTDAIQLLIVIVTVAGILDLLISGIIERRRELAVWQLIGADARAVRRSIVVEAGAIGVLAATLGVAVGFVTAWIWVRINFKYLLGYHLKFFFPIVTSCWYVVLVICMTMVAGYIAANRATRTPVLEFLQKE